MNSQNQTQVKPNRGNGHNSSHSIDNLDKAFSGDTIDDSNIKNIINPHATPYTSGGASSLSLSEESSQYLQIRTDERLTINLLQCLIHTGFLILQDHVRTKVLD